ncbi:hypothetical protein BSKO_08618 [Bryopsis sp. KO-2023]|nr:hypothetical protein BSKO_08618 [Bryopsis sp. KO-2023]
MDRFMQDAVRTNREAFEEETTVEVEAEHQHAAQLAWTRLRRFNCEPASQRRRDELDISIRCLRSKRSFYLPPVIQHREVLRAQGAQKPARKSKWNLMKSFFSTYDGEGGNRGLFEDPHTVEKQFSLDWHRVVRKSRFRKKIMKSDAEVRRGLQSVDDEIEEVRQILFENNRLLRQTFVYYSSFTPGYDSDSIFQMTLKPTIKFAQECRISDIKSRSITPVDLVSIFVCANHEEMEGTTEALNNSQQALVRFEFYEILVRLATAKYIYSGKMNDSSDAVSRLVEMCIAPHLPAVARHNPDDFRRNRLYTQQMDQLVVIHLPLLEAFFNIYKAKNKTKYFWVEHWLSFLKVNQMFGRYANINKQEAKLIFEWSQMLVVDELRKRQRAVSLQFLDFVEAIARLADCLSPPSDEELQAFFQKWGPPTTSTPIWEYYNRFASDDEEDDDDDDVNDDDVNYDVDDEMNKQPLNFNLEREDAPPLHINFAALMEILTGELRRAMGGKSEAETVQRMLRTAEFCSRKLRRA